MTRKLLLGLLLVPALSPAAAQEAPPPTGDPCEMARSIAHSRPCLAGAAECEAVERWRKAFGEPGVVPAYPELASLPAKMERQLPDRQVALTKAVGERSPAPRRPGAAAFTCPSR